MKSSSKAFTFIEVIFVVIIIGILAAVAIPKLEQIEAEGLSAPQSQPVNNPKGTTWN